MLAYIFSMFDYYNTSSCCRSALNGNNWIEKMADNIEI